MTHPVDERMGAAWHNGETGKRMGYAARLKMFPTNTYMHQLKTPDKPLGNFESFLKPIIAK